MFLCAYLRYKNGIIHKNTQHDNENQPIISILITEPLLQ